MLSLIYPAIPSYIGHLITITISTIGIVSKLQIARKGSVGTMCGMGVERE